MRRFLERHNLIVGTLAGAAGLALAFLAFPGAVLSFLEDVGLRDSQQVESEKSLGGPGPPPTPTESSAADSDEKEEAAVKTDGDTLLGENSSEKVCPASKYSFLNGEWEGKISCDGREHSFILRNEFYDGNTLKGTFTLEQAEDLEESSYRERTVELVANFDADSNRVTYYPQGPMAWSYPKPRIVFEVEKLSADSLPSTVFDDANNAQLCRTWSIEPKKPERFSTHDENGIRVRRPQPIITFDDRNAEERAERLTKC